MSEAPAIPETGVAASAIYVGEVSHTRLRPRRHALRYRLFMLLLDLDELPALSKRLRWFSLGRFNLTSFRERDHGDGSGTPLRTQVERHLDAAGLSIAGGPIRLLCLPRVLGYVFNPLSVYFCYTQDRGAQEQDAEDHVTGDPVTGDHVTRDQGVGHERLKAILYEVSSTFGERHSYLMPAEPDASGVVRQSAAKRLHVSPFMDMDLDYRFRILPPRRTDTGGALDVVIGTLDREGLLLNARFSAARRSLDDAGLIRAWFAHPLLTLKVIAGIHWEAVRLIAKGLRLKSGTTAPAEPVSLGAARSRDQTRLKSIDDPSVALPRNAIQVSAGSYQSAISASPRS